MTGTETWILCYLIDFLCWAWVIWCGGAEWLEGTFASTFLVSWLAPSWSAEGIRLFAWLSLLVSVVAFVVGFFVPDLRCWSTSC
jgi:hypothetical protein